MLTRIFTFTVGDRHDIVARTYLALLSAIAWAPREAEVALVTDRPGLYRWFGDRLRLYPIDAATVRAWRGRHDYFWRAKMQSLIYAAAQSPANILYLDSDVLVRKPLDDLVTAVEGGDVFLHVEEQDLAKAKRRGDRRMWRNLRGRTAAEVTFADSCPMWNAGVIAVGAERHALLERGLEILDALNDGGFDHWLAEQLSVGVALRETKRIRPAEAWMTHYWGNKEGYQPDIDQQLVHFLCCGMGVDEAAAYVREHPILKPVLVRRSRWWQKALRRLAG